MSKDLIETSPEIGNELPMVPPSPPRPVGRLKSNFVQAQTRESQNELTPQRALDLLKGGNERFVNNLRANRNLLNQVNETSDGQFPFAVVLSCIDSRVSAELVFDQGLGDIFSVRIAGNFVNDDILGSMEFGCKVSGSKLIMVLGHTRCGAIKGACDDVQLGYVTGLLGKIRPAVQATPCDGERSSKNYAFVDQVALTNVRATMKHITERSPILEKMLASGEIAIAGGVYDVQTGEVDFI